MGPLGFYEFNRLPFGLSNAPATYQRLMEECLGDLHLKTCLIHVYLDDLIIFSNTFDEHLQRLKLVLQRLRECGLKLAPKKCKFFYRKVAYVGHVVSAHGVETDPSKTDRRVERDCLQYIVPQVLALQKSQGRLLKRRGTMW